MWKHRRKSWRREPLPQLQVLSTVRGRGADVSWGPPSAGAERGDRYVTLHARLAHRCSYLRTREPCILSELNERVWGFHEGLVCLRVQLQHSSVGNRSSASSRVLRAPARPFPAGQPGARPRVETLCPRLHGLRPAHGLPSRRSRRLRAIPCHVGKMPFWKKNEFSTFTLLLYIL